MRRAALGLLMLAGCKRHAAPAPPDAGAAVVVAEPPPSTAKMLDAADLPLGHWETTDGAPNEKVCLTIMPEGLVRFATPVPSYRNPARVFGQVTHAEGDEKDPDAFTIWVEVSKIYAKEIGSCHRHWVDFELYEAEILGQRVTSPNKDAQKIPALEQNGNGLEPVHPWALKFSADRASLELCNVAKDAKDRHCRQLTKKKSPSDLSRVRTNGTCKVDEDCVLATDGEQCDPCLCPTKASLKSWPKRPAKPDDIGKDDESWALTPEHLCGKAITRGAECPVCPTLHAVCKNKVCMLKPQ